MQPSDRVAPVVAGAVDDHVFVRADRYVREVPLLKVPVGVRKRVVVQAHRVGGFVVNLDPVEEFAVFVRRVAHVLGHQLGDLDGAVGNLAVVVQQVVVFAGIAESRRGFVGHRPFAAYLGVGLVGAHLGDVQRLHGGVVRVEQHQRVARRGDAERRVIRVARVVAQRARAINQHALARRQRLVRKLEILDHQARVLGQLPAVQVHGLAGIVHDFHPVGVRAGVVLNGGRVGAHDLADAHGGRGVDLGDGLVRRLRQNAVREHVLLKEEAQHDKHDAARDDQRQNIPFPSGRTRRGRGIPSRSGPGRRFARGRRGTARGGSGSGFFRRILQNGMPP